MNAAPRRRAGGLRRTVSWLRWTVFALVFWFFVVPLVPGFGEAIDELRRVDRSMLLLGTALEFAALWFYSLLTHAALGPEARRLRVPTLFRIQLSTRALGSIVPGGSAASTALGFRLVTLAGIPGRDAGFALATAGGRRWSSTCCCGSASSCRSRSAASTRSTAPRRSRAS
jgi:uncharacterized membrane protein YbhN (UPF0104 family)